MNYLHKRQLSETISPPSKDEADESSRKETRRLRGGFVRHKKNQPNATQGGGNTP